MKHVLRAVAGGASLSLVPLMAFAETTCEINGQVVDCADIPGGVWAALGAFWIVFFALIILMIAAIWKIYVKAGQPGWASLIPVYNAVIMLRIVGKPEWWVILMFIPFVNIVISFIVLYRLARAFGRGTGTCIGLIFLPFIFLPILAFGNAAYIRPSSPAAFVPAPGGDLT